MFAFGVTTLFTSSNPIKIRWQIFALQLFWQNVQKHRKNARLEKKLFDCLDERVSACR